MLLERLIVNRPHPWGLLITFIELIKVLIFFSCNLYILQACLIVVGDHLEPVVDPEEIISRHN